VPAVVTINGVNFGATQGTSSVSLAGFTMTPSSWSNTSITFPVPNIGAVNGNLVVRVAGLSSNGVAFSVVPAIIASPVTGPLGTVVTITGNNFGATQGASTVTFAGVEAAPTSWSNTSITVPLPNGVPAGSQNLIVNVGGVINSASFAVTPFINNLSPTAGVIGTVVTVTGTSFGATQSTSTITFGTQNGVPTSWSDTKIVVPVPVGATTGNVVINEPNGGVSSNGVPFTINGAPVINTFSPGEGVIGTVVTLNGANFGASQGTSTVTFNGTVATPISWSNTIIVVPVPSGATNGNIVVTVAGAPSNGKPFVVSATGPTITSISPAGGPNGTVVTITGNNFGSTQGSSFVQLNTFTLMPTSWSNTSITAKLVNAPLGTDFIDVNVLAVASNSVAFTVVPNIALSPATGPVGTVVTITGSNFGSTQGSSSVTFNGIAATPSSWSNTTIVVPVPAGVPAGDVAVVVTAGGIVNPGTFSVTPAITTLSPTSGAVGTSVTITGTSFGATQGSSKVDFGVVPATPGSWSDTSITVLVPNGAVTGDVVVTVANRPSNGVLFTVKPGISLSPSSGPVGTAVTITGTNLGNIQGTSTVTFNGAPATPTSWSNTQIVVPVPAGATTGPVVVTVGGVASNGAPFTVAPGITGVSPTSGAVGTSVTINGSTFGATQGSSTVTFNGAAATPTSWSSSSIVAPVPGAATSGNLVVTVGGVASNGVVFTVPPTISSITPPSGTVGVSVTIAGTGFGVTQGSSTVTFNGTAATPASWSSTTITVPVPPAATTGNVVVTVNGVSSGGINFTVLPQITGVSPITGPVGTCITITGNHFGAAQGASTVTFAGIAATPTNWSDTSITVCVPAGVPAGSITIILTINGQSANFAFTVTPAITSLSPTAGTVGTSVTITGTSFGAAQGTSTVTFNGTAATPTTWNNTSIVVPVPNTATSGNVVVTVSNLASNGVGFAVKPAITSVSPGSAAAGTSVTITGTSFGATQGTSTVTFNGIAATPTSWSNTSIVAAVPAAAHTGNVEVDVAGLASNDVTFTVTGTPSITGVSPNPATVGGSITITGTGFGSTGIVTILGVTATTTAYSDMSITATVPSGLGGLTVGTVQVIVPLEPPSNPWPLSIVSPPQITGLSLSTGPVGMGFVIQGKNFGNTQGSSTVTINGVPQTTLFFGWTDTSIIVQVASGTTSGPVVVTTAGGSATGPAFKAIPPFSCQ
jgi:hypothetical protein